MAEDILAKLRVAVTVVGRAGGVRNRSGSSTGPSGESCRLRFESVRGSDCTVPRLFRVIMPAAGVPEGAGLESGSSSVFAGVESSASTPFLLLGRLSADGGWAPAAVLTEWLRVRARNDSSAVEETTLCGLRSRALVRRLLVLALGADCVWAGPSTVGTF